LSLILKQFYYKIKSVTLTNGNGNYYVSILTEFEKEIQILKAGVVHDRKWKKEVLMMYFFYSKVLG